MVESRIKDMMKASWVHQARPETLVLINLEQAFYCKKTTSNIVLSVTYFFGIMQCYNYLLYISFLANKGQIGCLDMNLFAW